MWNVGFYDSKLIEICFQVCNYQYTSIALDNGLAPSKRQAFIWTDNGQVSMMYICIIQLWWVKVLPLLLQQIFMP